MRRILLCIWILFAYAQQAFAGPFSCDGDIFQVQSGQLRIFDPTVSSYVDVGPQNSSYNATGYNPIDDFAYGSQGQNVIRTHSDGTIETVFNVGFSSYSGDVDDNNTLWLRQTSTRYVGIDLATGGQTVVNFTGTGQNVADAAFIRDSSGTRYLIGFAGGRVGRFNLDTGVSSRDNIPGLPGGGFGATWTDFGDRLFTFNNGTGEIFEITDYFTSTPTATLVAQGDPSGNNDGFSCPNPPL